jgi:hypothetical protein
VGEELRRKVKFWLLFWLGILVYTPFVMLSLMARIVLYAASSSVVFVVFLFLVYRSVYRGAKPKYPMAFPEGKSDIYFPRSNIPRPIYEDVRRHPDFFGVKKKVHELTKKMRKKKT